MGCGSGGGCGGSATPQNYSIVQPAVSTGKPLTALEIIQNIKVTRTKNGVETKDTKDN